MNLTRELDEIRFLIYVLGLAGFPVKKELRIMTEDAQHITVGKRRAFKAVKEQKLSGVVTTIGLEGTLVWIADPPEAVSFEDHPSDKDAVLAKGLVAGVVTITAEVDGLTASVGQKVVAVGGGPEDPPVPPPPPIPVVSLRIEISPDELESEAPALARADAPANPDAYTAGRLALEQQTPYSPPAEATERANYERGYQDAKALAQRT